MRTPTATVGAWSGTYVGPGDLHSRMQVTDALGRHPDRWDERRPGRGHARGGASTAHTQVIDDRHLTVAFEPVLPGAESLTPDPEAPEPPPATLTRDGDRVLVDGGRYPERGVGILSDGWYQRIGPVTTPPTQDR